MRTQIIDYYDYKNKTNKTMEMPNCTKYEFLVERNKKYMNYTALSTEDGRRITYEEMHDRIDKYARALTKKGIKKGDLVAVCSINTPEAIYVMYALDKIGAVNIGLSPLNTKYQTERDIELVKPKHVITVDMFYKNSKDILKNMEISPILFSPFESSRNLLLKTLYNLMQLKEGNKIF